MKITKTQIKSAGIKFIDLAAAVGLSHGAISKQPDLLNETVQYRLLHGSKEAQAIRRKVLRHLRKEGKDE